MMATKRSHTEAELDHIHPDRVRGDLANAKKRKPNLAPTAKSHKHKAKEGSIEYAKKRKRAIERLFQRDTELPQDVRNDMERELAAHKATIEDKTFHKRRSAMISKYHMVRFFERKKAMRLAKQIRKKIAQAEDQDELAQLQKELHVAEVDEAYTQYHPHAEPYTGLYGRTKSSDDDEALALADKVTLDAERPPMWKTVEAAMAEGTNALVKLRERRSADGSDVKPGFKPAKKQSSRTDAPKPAAQKQKREEQGTRAQNGAATPMNRRERRKLMHQQKATAGPQSDDEDGGFFE